MANKKNTWPVLQFDELKDTIYLLHHWTQIIGKVRLKKSSWQNHSWHVTLYVDSQGLTTGLVPYENGAFEIRLDFIHHEVRIKTTNGTQDRFSLAGQTVASFYQQLMEKLNFLGIQVKIHALPNEMPNPIPFAKNNKKFIYQANAAQKIWKALVHVNKEFNLFRSKFTGKSSPVHFFWGSFDLAYTRFSGKKAPVFEADVPNIPKAVMQESYSHEVFSVGFWLGNESFPTPSFYAYCYPNYPEFKKESVQPKEAYWSDDMGEFLLSYEVVQKSSNAEDTLRSFLQSAYEAATKVGNWDRESLDCDFSYFDQKK
ncbi:MAG: DUF5996 family protein [Algoriphagus sp.]|jgi:hypothetical protein|uniref:DUF5996 family protein n=1 Tax=Algoriphagus sp. TaxID=1872435 RepID=UPI002622FF74|nr:DUF5996 family protein [Algoriphagus sp.]MDG1278446.1 DUF5996 family protein [Algoriphagus sp.]